MKRQFRLLLLIILAIGLVLVVKHFLGAHNIAVLNPKGSISAKERSLIVTAILLMSLVVIPVFIMTAVIAWKYRAGNTSAKYTPDWDHNALAETIWWVLPSIIILFLSVMAWNSSHELDPFKQLNSTTPPITIQVVALEWKWLFIYPEQNIASVNFVQFPVNTPINFQITADAPMNSFWVPQLGGQIYAMSGMSTQLHLMANEMGDYRGSSANISGQGFAGMKFTARASSADDFDNWVYGVKQLPYLLSFEEYQNLAAPSENNFPIYYAASEGDLYDRVIQKFLPASSLGLDPNHGGRNH